MNIYEFGQQLLDTNDLDPVYVLIHHSDLEDWKLKRWLLAYWCFYHVGTASWIAEGDTGYWDRMMTAAKSKDYPRSSERRHFRGDNAIKSVEFLRDKGLPGLWMPFALGNTTFGGTEDKYVWPVKQIVNVVQSWKGFGPWISFKVADMLERLGLAEVAFDIDTVMYDSPQEAAELLWDVEGQPHAGFGSAAGAWAINRIMEELGLNIAPPRYERKINMQEAETILCKWKSYMNGHYHVGEDVAACRKGLLRFPKTRLCQDLIKAGKSGGLW